MSEPTIAAKNPIKVTLEAGRTYAWCRCGLSKSQPFCNGAHAGTGMAPLVWKAEQSGEAWLCQCKHAGKPPLCDGTHKTLP